MCYYFFSFLTFTLSQPDWFLSLLLPFFLLVSCFTLVCRRVVHSLLRSLLCPLVISFENIADSHLSVLSNLSSLWTEQNPRILVQCCPDSGSVRFVLYIHGFHTKRQLKILCPTSQSCYCTSPSFSRCWQTRSFNQSFLHSAAAGKLTFFCVPDHTFIYNYTLPSFDIPHMLSIAPNCFPQAGSYEPEIERSSEHTDR